jgi:hypothetical protein
MKYYLPDSQDLVDPSFDFATERRNATRLRHRDDHYAHEVFRTPVFDGLLVSKGIVDGGVASSGRYTLAQRHRLMRLGVHEYFRTSEVPWGSLSIMGDCGAFTYVKDDVPPYSVDDVLAFYSDGGFDLGVSVDHVILQFKPEWDESGPPADVKSRQETTLQLARDFLRQHQKSKLRFVPLGAAQGWSPGSYAHAVKELQKMGYSYIAVGGMVPLKTREILAALQGIAKVRKSGTKLHLLGVTRLDSISEFAKLGVASIDSTSPLRQAFKDDKDNYYTLSRQYTAIRIPQVEGNPGLQRGISSGKIPQDRARKLEKAAREAMLRFDSGDLAMKKVLDALQAYEDLYDPGSNHTEAYRETLEDKPWRSCKCDICSSIGHHVILFRGAERNRRRGLHNTWTFYRRLQRELGIKPMKQTRSAARGAHAT